MSSFKHWLGNLTAQASTAMTMPKWKILVVVLSAFFHLGNSSVPCPQAVDILPCFCSQTEKGQTTIACHRLNDSSEVQKVTYAMRGMVINSFVLIGRTPISGDTTLDEEEENEIDAEVDNSTTDARLPKEWLRSLRVKEVIIHGFSLSTCFLCDHPFVGQKDYLINLVATHASLEGHLCAVCNTKIKHVSTRELLNVPKLKSIDLSHNRIKIINGNGFPVMAELTKVDLSNNEIVKIYDNAFVNLATLSQLDLSRNKLLTVSRKMFRQSDNTLTTIDLSWNSIQHLPNDMFKNLRRIKEVSLTHNLLETLPPETWSILPSLVENINVNGNLLICNCSLSWFGRLPKTAKYSAECVNPTTLEIHDIKSSHSGVSNCF